MLVCIRELTAAFVPSNTSMKSFCLTVSSFRCITSDYKHMRQVMINTSSITVRCVKECSCSHDWWRVLRASSRQRWASETRTGSADPPLHRHTPHTPDHARNPTRTHSGAYCWNSPEQLSETDPTHHWETHTDRQTTVNLYWCFTNRKQNLFY